MSASIGVSAKSGQNFRGGGPHVDGDVGRIVELTGHPRAGSLLDDFKCAGDGALHALFARGQVEARAIGKHQAPPLERHRFGHDEDELVALDRSNHGQTDAGVARGRLDDGAAGLEAAVSLRSLDHRQCDAVLDRTAGIGAFALHPYLVVGKQAGEANVRGIADGGENIGRFHVASFW
jgi:hypothetical protein